MFGFDRKEAVFAPKCPIWESTRSAVVSVHFKDKVGSSSNLFQRERVGFVREGLGNY